MKKYIFIIFTFLNVYLNAMEQQITKESREWDAQAYAQGNWIQKQAALQFFKESGIDLKDKNVLDVGCGTGNISHKLSKTAQTVHGIDASKNMIDYAQKTYNTNNLTFEHVFAENFITQKFYDTVVTFFCLHHIKDQQEVLKKINMCLINDGECFGITNTASNPLPIGLTIALEMLPKLQQDNNFFKNKDVIQGLTTTHATNDSLETMLKNAGFEIISYELKVMDFIIKNQEELEKFETPLVLSHPVVQMMRSPLREWVLKQYFDLYLTKLQKNTDGHYILPAINTTVFHARKIADLK